MAASKAMRLAQRQARALRPTPRPPLRIGQWREAQGLAPSPTGPGPLRDLPDWSFVDGRPSPPWRGQLRRREENAALARRAVTLSRVLEAAATTRAGEGRGKDPTPSLRPKGPVRTSKGLGSPSPTPGGSGGGLPREGVLGVDKETG